MLTRILKAEKFIGSVKFAVIIVLLFAASLTYGTFIESLYNTDYANRLVYKSIPFMLLQAAMFVSIFIATTLRFPYKRRLFGFYILHLGLLLIFVGSFVTYIVGIDGNMELFPNSPNRIVKLGKTQLEINDLSKNKKFVMDMPYNHNETQLNAVFEDLKFSSYLPFAKLERQWIKSKLKTSRSSQYLLKNENFTQDFILSSHPDSEAQPSLTLGLLNIHYLPNGLADCFASSSKQSKDLAPYIIWDTQSDTCQNPSPSNSSLDNKDGKEFLKFKDLYFLPEVSPVPVNKTSLKMQHGSRLRVFSKKLFQERPHLFVFGDKVAYYDKDESKWSVDKVGFKESTSLPWMGFEISLLKDTQELYPVQRPVYSAPKANKNRTQALKLTYQAQDYWLTAQSPLRVGTYEISLRPEQITLPFQINLEKFRMDKDPGTQNPASYESYVNVFNGQDSHNQKVFMNNPLKWDQFTFYQASYFPLKNGLYGSVLSVNYDPGRFLKYLGSILLVLGSFWHFYLRKKKWFA